MFLYFDKYTLFFSRTLHVPLLYIISTPKIHCFVYYHRCAKFGFYERFYEDNKKQI